LRVLPGGAFAHILSRIPCRQQHDFSASEQVAHRMAQAAERGGKLLIIEAEAGDVLQHPQAFGSAVDVRIKQSGVVHGSAFTSFWLLLLSSNDRLEPVRQQARQVHIAEALYNEPRLFYVWVHCIHPNLPFKRGILQDAPRAPCFGCICFWRGNRTLHLCKRRG
jgi:hypothetical protein